MSRRPIDFHLSGEDQKAIGEILRAGIQQVRVVLRAMALEQLSAGLTAPAVARMVHLSPQAVRRIAHRYQQGGLDQAVYERGGRGSKELLDASQKQRVIAMVCSCGFSSGPITHSPLKPITDSLRKTISVLL
jgi:putative transposase